jgi:hypothetical protein
MRQDAAAKDGSPDERAEPSISTPKAFPSWATRRKEVNQSESACRRGSFDCVRLGSPWAPH